MRYGDILYTYAYWELCIEYPEHFFVDRLSCGDFAFSRGNDKSERERNRDFYC